MSVQPVCFVVMGFGKKTAYSKDKPPRVLDLDATFEAIIEPAVRQAGFKCVRADKILHSGMIDVPMYKMLLGADLVIADISTGNVNAVYELGVRHALRPRSTIIMMEDQGDFSFDLNHIRTFTYEHLGSDIGTRVAKTKVEALKALILATEAAEDPDSPVHICLGSRGEAPSIASSGSPDAPAEMNERVDPLAQWLADGRHAMKHDEFETAAVAFARALSILEQGEIPAAEQDPYAYVVQQLALATYKSEKPSKLDALRRGQEVLAQLSPTTSSDIETLGISGAIHKRIHSELSTRLGRSSAEARAHLDRAIESYGSGYTLTHDYYNGENYANLLDLRAALQANHEDAVCDRVTARRARELLVRSLTSVIDVEALEAREDTPATSRSKMNFFQHPDWDWMLASLANCLYALGRDSEAQRYEDVVLTAAKNAHPKNDGEPDSSKNPDWDYGTVELDPWLEQDGKARWKLATYLDSRALAQAVGSGAFRSQSA